jgi:Icc-related predicted phosphoesterase
MSLTLGYVSDLHLEVSPSTALDRVQLLAEAMEDVDVLVIAGDFSSDFPWRTATALVVQSLQTRLLTLCERMGDIPVVYVPGNHEFYRSSFDEINLQLQDIDELVDNLHVLNDGASRIHGQRFVGTTLWFPHRCVDVDMRLQDFEAIADASRQIEQRGRQTAEFLMNRLQRGDVVVTHHLPAWECVEARYEGHSINRFYVHNVRPLIEDVKPKLWIHGHSHSSLDMQIGETRVVRNPYGYEGYETNPNFDWGARVEI